MKKNMKLNKLVALAVLMGGVTCCSSVWAGKPAEPPASPANAVFIYQSEGSQFNGIYPEGVSAANLGGSGVGIISGDWGTSVDKIVTWDGSAAGGAIGATGGVYGIKTEGANFVKASSISGGIEVASAGYVAYGMYLTGGGNNIISGLGDITVTSNNVAAAAAHGIYAKNGNTSADTTFSVSFVTAGGAINSYSASGTNYGILFDTDSQGKSHVEKVKTIQVGFSGEDVTDGVAYGIQAQAGVNVVDFIETGSSIAVKSKGGNASGIEINGGTNTVSNLGGILAEAKDSHTAFGINLTGGTNTIYCPGSITATSENSEVYGVRLTGSGKNTIACLDSITATSISGAAYGISSTNTNDAPLSPTEDATFSVAFDSDNGGTIKAYSESGANYGIMFAKGTMVPKKDATGKTEVLNVNTIVAGVNPDNDKKISSGMSYGVYAKAGVNTVTFTGKDSSITAKSSGNVAYGLYLAGGTNYIGAENKELGSITAETSALTGAWNVYGIYTESGENEITFAGTGSSITANIDDGNSYGISFGSSSTAATGTTKITGLGSIVSDPKTGGKTAYGIYARNGNDVSDGATFKVEFVDNTVATDGIIAVYSASGENYGIMFELADDQSKAVVDPTGKSEVLHVKKIQVGVDLDNPTDATKYSTGPVYGIQVHEGVNTVTFTGAGSSIIAKSNNKDAVGINLCGGTNYIGMDGNGLGSITSVNSNGDAAYGIEIEEGVNNVVFSGSSSSVTAIAETGLASFGIHLMEGGNSTISGLGSITVEAKDDNGCAYGIYTITDEDTTNTIDFAEDNSFIKVKGGGEGYGIAFGASDMPAAGTTKISKLSSIVASTIWGNACGVYSANQNAAGDAAAEATFSVTFDSDKGGIIKAYSEFAGNYGIWFNSHKELEVELVTGKSEVLNVKKIEVGMDPDDPTNTTYSSETAYGIRADVGVNTVAFMGKDSSITVKGSGEVHGIYTQGGTNTITGLGKMDVTFASSYENIIYSTGGSTTLEFAADGPGLINVVNNATSGKDDVQVVAVAGSSSMTIKNLKGINVTGLVATKLEIADGTVTLVNSTIEATEGVNTIGAYAGANDTLYLQNNSKVSGDIDIQGATLTVNVDSTSELHIGEITTSGGTLNATNAGKISFEKTGTVGTLTNNAGTVEANAKGISATTIIGSAGVEQYAFTIPTGIAMDGSEAMLNITGDTALTFTSGDILSVNSNDTLADGAVIALIHEKTGTFSLSGLSFYVDDTQLTEGIDEYFKLSDDEKSILFINPVRDVDIKPDAKAGGNIVVVIGDRTAKVNGADPAKTPTEGRNWKNVYGGYAETGDAKDNDVAIKGGTIKGDVYGGYSKTGDACSNEILWEDGTIEGKLIGGYSETAGKDIGGNWLELVHKGTTKNIKDIRNFSSYWFDINAAKNNDTVLKITDAEETLNMPSGQYVVTIEDSKNDDLRYAGRVCLIESNKGINDVGVTQISTEDSDGIVDTYGHYTIEDGKKLIYTKTSEMNKDGSKAPVEGMAAAAAAINTSSDLVLGAGISNLITSTAEVTNTEIFAAGSYDKSKLKTGSHVDVSGYGVVVGVGKKVISKNGNKTTGGLFFEYGNSNYDTYNNGYNGDGKSIHKGAGYLMRWDNKSGNYYEGMVHVGKVTNNWNNGDSYNYEMSPTYYGAAATYGHKFMLGENKQLSVYGSYIYNHTGDGDAVIGNYKYNFEATNSHRTKVGVRYALSDLMDTKKVRPYVGLAWEHEFDGKSEAKFSAIRGSFKDRIDAPNMKGDTGILEIGCKQEVGKWTLGISAETFVGKRKGWNGTLQAVYNF